MLQFGYLLLAPEAGRQSQVAELIEDLMSLAVGGEVLAQQATRVCVVQLHAGGSRSES